MELENFFHEVVDSEHIFYKIITEYYNLPYTLLVYNIDEKKSKLVFIDLFHHRIINEVFFYCLKHVNFYVKKIICITNFNEVYVLEDVFSSKPKIGKKKINFLEISDYDKLKITFLKNKNYFLLDHNNEIYVTKLEEDEFHLLSKLCLNKKILPANFFTLQVYKLLEDEKTFIIFYKLDSDLYQWKIKIDENEEEIYPNFIYTKENNVFPRDLYFYFEKTMFFFETEVNSLLDYNSYIVMFNFYENKIRKMDLTKYDNFFDGILLLKENENEIILVSRKKLLLFNLRTFEINVLQTDREKIYKKENKYVGNRLYLNNNNNMFEIYYLSVKNNKQEVETIILYEINPYDEKIYKFPKRISIIVQNNIDDELLLEIMNNNLLQIDII